jgi:hypothetical protein
LDVPYIAGCAERPKAEAAKRSPVYTAIRASRKAAGYRERRERG